MNKHDYAGATEVFQNIIKGGSPTEYKDHIHLDVYVPLVLAEVIQSALEKAPKYDRLMERLESGEVSSAMVVCADKSRCKAYASIFKAMLAQLLKEVSDERSVLRD